MSHRKCINMSVKRKPRLKAIFVTLVLFALIIMVIMSLSKLRSVTSNINSTKECVTSNMNSTKEFFTFSAYYIEHRGSKIIRVVAVGMTNTESNQQIFCNFLDANYATQTNSSVTATKRIVRDHVNKKFTACYIECEIDEDMYKKVRYVSVVSTDNNINTNILRIHFPPPEVEKTHVDFSVCVRPMDKHITNILFLLEWIELHKLLGVERFTIYNESIRSDVGCVFDTYKEIEIIPFSLPLKNKSEIHERGQLVAMNDCNFRHRGVSKYVIHIDIDELIVPSFNLNYSTLLKKSTESGETIGAFSFRNAFFFLEWPDNKRLFPIEGNSLATKVSRKLFTARKTQRHETFFPHRQRSKYICDPKAVDEAGIHMVYELVDGYVNQNVDVETAYLHHYRRCEDHLCVGPCDNDSASASVDNSCHNYTVVLAMNVANKLKEVATKCNLNVNTILDSK